MSNVLHNEGYDHHLLSQLIFYPWANVSLPSILKPMDFVYLHKWWVICCHNSLEGVVLIRLNYAYEYIYGCYGVLVYLYFLTLFVISIFQNEVYNHLNFLFDRLRAWYSSVFSDLSRLYWPVWLEQKLYI